MSGPAGGRGSVVLVSCYELGHQPFAVASAWAQLEGEGFEVAARDASVEAIDDAVFDGAGLIAFSVPMHTALRLGVELAARARARNPGAHVCMFGLYASMNARHLIASGAVDSVIGGEFESALTGLAMALRAGSPVAVAEVAGVTTRAEAPPAPVLARLPFRTPRREGLPALDRYAKLIGPRAGEERVVGYVEASRGCLHRCLHCPVTGVYDGRFFVVPREVVLADVAQQVAAGARHITFGDPDFFNGPGHSMSVVRALHEAHPEVTFDVTTKIENILRHRDKLSELAGLGCLFVVSAVESLADGVLAALDKGHTRADVLEALALTREAGIALRPSYVAFTPWTTLEDYIELCDHIVVEGLVDAVDPIQLAIRLLVPPGSALLRGNAPRPWLRELVAEQFGHRWEHPDPRMDALHAAVSAAVEEGAASNEDPARTIDRVRRLAYAAAGRELLELTADRRFVPHLTEPWFCCAEPSAAQMAKVSSCCPASTPAPARG